MKDQKTKFTVASIIFFRKEETDWPLLCAVVKNHQLPLVVISTSHVSKSHSKLILEEILTFCNLGRIERGNESWGWEFSHESNMTNRYELLGNCWTLVFVCCTFQTQVRLCLNSNTSPLTNILLDTPAIFLSAPLPFCFFTSYWFD